MLLALYGYAIVIIFMALIMSKKLSALTSLLIVPVVIGCIVFGAARTWRSMKKEAVK